MEEEDRRLGRRGRRHRPLDLHMRPQPQEEEDRRPQDVEDRKPHDVGEEDRRLDRRDRRHRPFYRGRGTNIYNIRSVYFYSY